MGFMDKAKKLAEQAQQQAKDGTLKERAKVLAEQAQQKLDEVQGQFNAGQQSGAGSAGAAAPVEYDQHGRPVTPPAEAAAPPAPQEPAPAAEPVAAAAPAEPPPAPAPDAVADVDRSADRPPTITSGDPLAG